MRILLLLGFSIVASGCVETSPPPLSKTTNSLRSFLHDATKGEIRACAIAQAQEDIRRGTPHVARTGGRASFAWNIPQDMACHVEHLPEVPHLPTGCSDPLLNQAQIFAAAYNGELVKHLLLTGSR